MVQEQTIMPGFVAKTFELCHCNVSPIQVRHARPCVSVALFGSGKVS
jgi:hypothetical protein